MKEAGIGVAVKELFRVGETRVVGFGLVVWYQCRGIGNLKCVDLSRPVKGCRISADCNASRCAGCADYEFVRAVVIDITRSNLVAEA